MGILAFKHKHTLVFTDHTENSTSASTTEKYKVEA